MKINGVNFESLPPKLDKEETKGEALVAFTEEDRRHQDLTKFYKRFLRVDDE